MKPKFKPRLTLTVTDVLPELHPALRARLQAGTRGVRVTHDGWLRTDLDWRRVFAKWVKRLFPHAWVYTGGHHLAVHASAPAQPGKWRHEEGGEAGRLLFAIQEAKLP